MGILFLIFLLGASARFIGLGHNPIGIVDDEAQNGYDAYSLLRTGKDQWGESWPLVSFQGFGDYRIPGYTYLSMFSVSAFGLTPFAIRFPAALFGSLTVFAVYALVKELFRDQKNNTVPLLASFILAISPWHIGMSRIGLEETTSVFIVTLAFIAFLSGRRHVRRIVPSAILFGLSLYLYTANIVFLPVVMCFTWYIFRKEYIKHIKYVFFAAACFLLIAAPILFSFGTSTAVTRTRQINLTTDSGIIDGINEKQGSCSLVFPKKLCRVIFNKYAAYAVKFTSNYINHFSPNLLSISGTHTQYSILPMRGLLYLFEYPLLFIACVYFFSVPTPTSYFLIGYLLLSAVPDSLTSDGQFARFFISYPVWPILCAVGISKILSLIKKKILIIACIAAYLLAFCVFLTEYFSFYPFRYSHYSHFGYEELIKKIQEYKGSYDRVVVSSRVNDAKQYIYYLFYTRYDPKKFQSGKGIEKAIEPNGWVKVTRINSIEFTPSLPGRDEVASRRVLLIGAPSEFHTSKPIPEEFTVKDKAGNILFVGVDSSKFYL